MKLSDKLFMYRHSVEKHNSRKQRKTYSTIDSLKDEYIKLAKTRDELIEKLDIVDTLTINERDVLKMYYLPIPEAEIHTVQSIADLCKYCKRHILRIKASGLKKTTRQ